jgi:excisionase family DNA binding protein
MSDDDSSDLLNGVNAIAKYLNLTPRQVYHLAESGSLPLFKFGGAGQWRGRKSTLSKHIDALECAAMKGGEHREPLPFTYRTVGRGGQSKPPS